MKWNLTIIRLLHFSGSGITLNPPCDKLIPLIETAREPLEWGTRTEINRKKLNTGDKNKC
jgi:hypothetical protein